MLSARAIYLSSQTKSRDVIQVEFDNRNYNLFVPVCRETLEAVVVV